MRRAAVERQRTVRVWRQHLSYIHKSQPTLCICDQQPGRFRKGQRMAGCSQAHCYLCHGDKLMKRPTFQQWRSDISFNEWKEEAGKPIVTIAG